MAGQRARCGYQATLPSQSNGIRSDAEGVKRLVYWGRPGGSPVSGNGRISQLAASPQAEGVLERVRSYVRQAGRDPGAFGIEGTWEPPRRKPGRRPWRRASAWAARTWR